MASASKMDSKPRPTSIAFNLLSVQGKGIFDHQYMVLNRTPDHYADLPNRICGFIHYPYTDEGFMDGPITFFQLLVLT